jgi:hypothetical protein
MLGVATVMQVEEVTNGVQKTGQNNSDHKQDTLALKLWDFKCRYYKSER